MELFGEPLGRFQVFFFFFQGIFTLLPFILRGKNPKLPLLFFQVFTKIMLKKMQQHFIFLMFANYDHNSCDNKSLSVSQDCLILKKKGKKILSLIV